MKSISGKIWVKFGADSGNPVCLLDDPRFGLSAACSDIVLSAFRAPVRCALVDLCLSPPHLWSSPKVGLAILSLVQKLALLVLSESWICHFLSILYLSGLSPPPTLGHKRKIWTYFCPFWV